MTDANETLPGARPRRFRLIALGLVMIGVGLSGVLYGYIARYAINDWIWSVFIDEATLDVEINAVFGIGCIFVGPILGIAGLIIAIVGICTRRKASTIT